MIPGIVNPLTLDRTDTFLMQTMTLDGSIMDILTSGLTLKMTQVPYIRSVLVETSSLINSALSKYTFIITPTVPINNTYSIVVKFPPEITLPSDPSIYKCSSDDLQLISSVNCLDHKAFVLNGVRFVLNIKTGTGINPLQPFRLSINGIQNPPTTKSTKSFEVSITDAQLGILSQLNTVSNPVSVMMNTPNTIKKAEF